jgi:hypothetical protein
MTDEQIVEAVRSGTHTLVPMPVGRRKWYVGPYGCAAVAASALVLILDLFDDECEGEEMCGAMMGELTRCDEEWSIQDAKAGKHKSVSSVDDGEIPF